MSPRERTQPADPRPAPPESPASRRPAGPPPDLGALERSWGTPRGLWGSLATVDHKRIGKRYIATALVFFALGGIEAFLIRLQLSRTPESALRGRELLDEER